MTDRAREQELQDRLRLVEDMIAEGRRDTAHWGWSFVLWGVAYYVALAWSTWGRSPWAWPVTVVAASLATAAGASLNTRGRPNTTVGRAIGSIWIALGISMLLLFLALGASGRLADPHLFFAFISAILGMANGASGLLLRWKTQCACAGVWWIAAVVSCFGAETQSLIVFLAAIFLCQIVFGVYGMIADIHARNRPRIDGNPAHA